MGIITLGTPTRLTRVELLGTRILRVLERRGGSCRYREVRATVGGKIRTDDFTAAVDALVADGSVVEVFLGQTGACAPKRVLARPGQFEVGPSERVIRARGLAEVLRNEPYAKDLPPVETPPAETATEPPPKPPVKPNGWLWTAPRKPNA